MNIWIARDDSGSLWIYSSKPYMYGLEYMPQVDADLWKLPTEMYPEVTFENSPVELVTLIENPQL